MDLKTMEISRPRKQGNIFTPVKINLDPMVLGSRSPVPAGRVSPPCFVRPKTRSGFWDRGAGVILSPHLEGSLRSPFFSFSWNYFLSLLSSLFTYTQGYGPTFRGTFTLPLKISPQETIFQEILQRTC